MQNQRLWISGYTFRQEFERDKAIKPRVFGLVNHTHAAAAQLLDDPVVRDGLADHWRESYVCETVKSMNAAVLGISEG